MYFSFLVFKTSEKYKFGGLYIKIFEKFEFRKKKFRQSRDENFEKSVFCKKFQSKSYFSMSNLNLECSQLSFDIHIAYVGKKWQIFKFFIPKGSKFSKSNQATLAPPSGKTIHIAMCSMTLLVDKDPNFHLRSCLVDLDEK